MKKKPSLDDMTACSGKGCKQKKKCYRYTGKRSQLQSYFLVEPWSTPDKCYLFWGEAQEYIIKKIKGGK